MSIASGVSLVIGAVLAIAGGMVQRHLQFRRQLRVVARVLYEDVLSKIGSIHVERQRIAQVKAHGVAWIGTPESYDDEELVVDTGIWDDSQGVIAEIRSTSTYDLVKAGYAAASSYRMYPCRHVLQWEMEQGILDRSFGIGEDSDAETYYECRDDHLDGAVDVLKVAAYRLARWAGVRKKRAVDDVAQTRPSDDQAAPGYSFEVRPLRWTPVGASGQPDHEESIEMHLVRPYRRRDVAREAKQG